MKLLSFIFWTWSLGCLLLYLTSFFGAWVSQTKVSVNRKNALSIFFLTASLGTLFFFLGNGNFIFAIIPLIIFIYFLRPLTKDFTCLYGKEVWSLELKEVERILPFYNPRIYWLALASLSGIFVLLWQPLDQFLSWEVLIGVIAIYYLGVLLLLRRINAFSLVLHAVSENSWTEALDSSFLFPKYLLIITFRFKGILSWEKVSSSYLSFYGEAPGQIKEKLFLCKIFSENYESFISQINKSSNFIKLFSKEEQLFVLEKLINFPSLFDSFWQKLSLEYKASEEFIWEKIYKERLQGNYGEIEKLVTNLKSSEELDELIEDIKNYKLDKIRDFNYLNSNLNDYIISEEDYLRVSPKDRLFIKKYKMEIYEIFNNSCVKTRLREDIEIDHFFIPKSKGGSFLMKRKDGLWVVNAIILNKKNNIIKGNKKIEDFFSIEELEKINYKLKNLSIKVNYDLWGND